MSDDPIHVRRSPEVIRRCEDEHSGVPSLSVAEFIERSEREPWLIIDARPRRERLMSVIPGSVSLVQFRFQRAPREGKRLLLYCTVGRRSGAHVRRLHRRGLPAYNLEGGVLAWAAAGQPLVTLDGLPTRRVHVHRRPSDVLPPGYQAVGAA